MSGLFFVIMKVLNPTTNPQGQCKVQSVMTPPPAPPPRGR